MTFSSSFFFFFFFSSFIFTFILSSFASNLNNSHTIVLPIKKDDETNQYYTSFSIGTPKLPVNAVVNLAGDSLWLGCSAAGYKSSSYRSIRCKSDKCSFSNSPTSCIDSKCSYSSYNPYLNMIIGDELAEDVFHVSHGLVTVPKFPFTCVESILLGRLTNESRGMIGLSRNRFSLPAVFLRNFNKIPRKFAICLPSSRSSGQGLGSGSGHIFIGGGPYHMPPYPKDMSKNLLKTPLLTNPVSSAPVRVPNTSSDEYFINVTSIIIDQKHVRFNKSLLSFGQDGSGGTRISTTTPYTTLHSSIYKSFLRYFVVIAKHWKMERVKTVSPFGACYDSRSVSYGRTGPAVPPVDLVLQRKEVYWRIYGGNSMVKVSEDVMCLGFVDGGTNQYGGIVIGAHQLEDNLVEFHVGSEELGFSSSLLLYNTSCSHDGN